METLKEIMRVVTLKADIKRVFPELLDAESAQSVTTTYVKGIIDNQYRDDDEAASQLYGGNRTDQRYRTLKSRVYDRLLAALLNLQVKQPEHSLYLTMYYKCSRNTVAAQTLMRFASRKSGVQLAERTLSIADKFHFTDLQIALCYSLRTSMALLRNNRTYNQYDSKLSQLLDIQRAELESDYLLDQTLLITSKQVSTRNEPFDYKAAIDRIENLRNTYSTNTLNLNYFRLKSTYHESNFEYHDLILVCDEALSYFSENEHLSLPARVGEFSLMKAIACSAMRQFDTAVDMSRICMNSFNKGGNNWYLAVDIGYTAAMNAKAFESALFFHNEALNDSRYQALPLVMQERWTTYSAYLHLAKELNLIKDDDDDRVQNKNFRLITYLNSVPEFSKEKKYSNYLVIVSHICFLLVKRKFDDAERRSEYLRTYSLRYLKEPQFERARVFIKILQYLSRSFDEAKADGKYLESMMSDLEQTKDMRHGNEVNEIIPYEVIVDSLLNCSIS